MVSPEAAVVPVTAAASAVSELSPAVGGWITIGEWMAVAAETDERTGSWFPWLAGFLPGALVVLVAYLVLRRLRRRR